MGFFSSASSTKKSNQQVKKKTHNTNKVCFTDISNIKHEYSFDWDLESDYWYSKGELKGMAELRFDDADVLRKERGIRTASRNDADEMTQSSRIVFIGDKITNALDDCDDNHEISIRGIEHFVFPVLQKEMVNKKKLLKKVVLGYSRDPIQRKKDPNGIKLADESAEHSKWARDVATERGIKYCQMKRGLLAASKNMNKNTKVTRRGFFANALSTKTIKEDDSRDDTVVKKKSFTRKPVK